MNTAFHTKKLHGHRKYECGRLQNYWPHRVLCGGEFAWFMDVKTETFPALLTYFVGKSTGHGWIPFT